MSFDDRVIFYRLSLIRTKLEQEEPEQETPATKEEVLAILAGETDPTPEPPSNVIPFHRRATA